jgi:hypothetical protein
VSCVHGGREWGANAEIELQDCGCPQSKFASGSRASKAPTDVNKIEPLINESNMATDGGGKIRTVLVACAACPSLKEKQESSMAKIDLDSLNIEELASLRDRGLAKDAGALT